MTKVLLGLGSNLGDRLAFLQRAVKMLDALEGVQLLAKSSLYQTPPWGVCEQPAFYNAVVEVECDLLPVDLLQQTQQIELDLGRERHEHWGARTLDIDILLYGDEVIALSQIKVPHPYLAERLFVLFPLAEVAADFYVPELGLVSDLLAQRLELEPENKIEKIYTADTW